MTLVSRIIERAFREGNLSSELSNPTPTQATEALELLNSLVASVYGFEAGDLLQPFPIGGNNINSPSGFPWWDYPADSWYLPLNQRVMLNLTQPIAINLHPMPQDGARFAVRDESNNLATYNLTLQGNGRLIDGANSLVVSTNGFSGEWLYRDDLGDWKRVLPLASGDTFPFPEKYDAMFETMLAVRINPRYGADLPALTASTMERSRGNFRAQYNQTSPQPSDPGLLNMSVQTYRNTRWGQYGPQPSIGDTGVPWGRFWR